jgi:imidazolonepropionase-like amidohydrolase
MAPADRQLVLSNRRLVVAALHAASGRILAGTDSGIDQTAAGTSIHDELAELVASGLSPYEALWGGTYGGALFLEKADEIGSVSSGHRADLLLLDRNPLEEVSAARNPRGVMWHGLWRVDPRMSRAVVSPCFAGAPPDCRRRRTRTVVH